MAFSIKKYLQTSFSPLRYTGMKTQPATVTNEWDLLAERFNTHKKNGMDIHPDAAVNIYLGWPVFFDEIQKQSEFLHKKSLTIMDFGCGAGELCNKLHGMGHEVIGTDKSEAMLSLAKENSDDGIKYCFSHECDMYEGKIDVVTSMHVLDWIEDVSGTLQGLSKLLKPQGLMLLSVFPKGHIIESLKIKHQFEDFDSETDPSKGFINFDGIRVPVFVHDASFYDNLFNQMGYTKVSEVYPPFPQDFIEKYQWDGAKFPEMMILAYRKL